jgi:hypothetical protein
VESLSACENHECLPPIPPVLSRQLYVPQKEDPTKQQETSDNSTLEGTMDELQQKWISFQNQMDLSYRGATSKEFYDLAITLVNAGQRFPTVSPQHLFKLVSRETFKKLRKNLAEKKRMETINKLQNQRISLSFDSSKVGRNKILISYICSPILINPLFFQATLSPQTQAEYADCALRMITDLRTRKVFVGSVCVDGLRAQVNALSPEYQGFFQITLFPYPFLL